MLRKGEHAKKKWGGANDSIDQWLTERQDLLVNYFKLAALPPYETVRNGLPDITDIREFCGQLVDYVSSGHFEIYGQLINAGKDHHVQLDDLMDDLFPLISDTTDIALDFNDTYGQVDNNSDLNKFDRDLSALGEAIELRMEFEDQLLNHLHENELLKR
ncbi:regulator of sigma D [Idiomarina aquatica]|jgi:regulator of sigma D|uniref:Regulator of sigma D n=1 Tax=Idiomarina aquatica TaxID=1327752 RepID=A0A4R6PIQ9_9GAMM|nr:sigma D regulator [Idiomarina aquatica]TDP37550.1 regulator of sigma D [Idiomarina aquatica]